MKKDVEPDTSNSPLWSTLEQWLTDPPTELPNSIDALEQALLQIKEIKGTFDMLNIPGIVNSYVLERMRAMNVLPRCLQSVRPSNSPCHAIGHLVFFVGETGHKSPLTFISEFYEVLLTEVFRPVWFALNGLTKTSVWYLEHPEYPADGWMAQQTPEQLAKLLTNVRNGSVFDYYLSDQRLELYRTLDQKRHRSKYVWKALKWHCHVHSCYPDVGYVNYPMVHPDKPLTPKLFDFIHERGADSEQPETCSDFALLYDMELSQLGADVEQEVRDSLELLRHLIQARIRELNAPQHYGCAKVIGEATRKGLIKGNETRAKKAQEDKKAAITEFYRRHDLNPKLSKTAIVKAMSAVDGKWGSYGTIMNYLEGIDLANAG